LVESWPDGLQFSSHFVESWPDGLQFCGAVVFTTASTQVSVYLAGHLQPQFSSDKLAEQHIYFSLWSTCIPFGR
jgi:hypothetical protein